MIDISFYIHKTMKREIFKDGELNNAARVVLAELKTKQIDVRDNITTEYQYKTLIKMRDDREKTIQIYHKASRFDLEKKELAELSVIKWFINILAKDMPQLFSEDQTIKLVEEFKTNNPQSRIGDFMKYITINKINVDKKIAALLFNK